MLPKSTPAGVVCSVKQQVLGPPPTIQATPQPLPPPVPAKAPGEPKKLPSVALVKGINQNKNPNIGLNMKNGVEIMQNSKNFEKLSENLRNISNMIPMTRPTPVPAVAPVKNKSPQNESSPKNDSKMSDIMPPKKPEIAWEKKTEEELQKICGEHEKIVNVILEEEEEMIAAHKQHVDEIVEMVKQEMQLLQEVDKPGSDVEAYAASLDLTLAHKMEAISSLREKLSTFRGHLSQEKELSSKFFEQQNEINDVFDLHEPEKETKGTEDMQMLTTGLDIPMSN